jgi:hypothetical protein
VADGGARAYRPDQAGVARLRTLYDVRVDGSL